MIMAVIQKWVMKGIIVKKLGKNYIYNTLYQLLMILMPLVTTPYAARVLGPEKLGIYSFTGANVNYFILLANIGFSLYGQKIIASLQDDFKKRSQAFWNIIIAKCLVASVALVIFIITNAFFFSEYQDIYWIQAIGIVSVFIDISWFFMGLENFRITVIRNLIVKVSFVILLFLFVKSPDNLPLYVFIIVAGNFFGNITLWFQLKSYINKPKLFQIKISDVIRNATVLFIPTVAINMYVTLNKTMIGLLDSKINVGFFVQSDTVIKLVLAVVTSLGTVMMPHMTKLISDGKQKTANELIYKSFSAMTLLAMPIMIGMIIISGRFTSIFYGHGFEPVGTLLAIESVSVLLIAWSNVLGVQYLVPRGKLTHYSSSVTIGAVFNIIINPILLIHYGVNGSMWAMVMTELIVFSVQLYFTKKDLLWKKIFLDLPKYVCATLGMLLILSLFNYWVHVPQDILFILYNVIIGTMTYTVFVFVFKPTVLKDVINLIKRRNL